MELLFEEVFKKILKLRKNSMTLTLIVNFLIYLVIGVLVLLIIFAVITGKFYLVASVFGIIFIAEIAHSIRKSREKKAFEKIENKYGVKDMMKSEGQNKGLLKINKNKNQRLLK